MFVLLTLPIVSATWLCCGRSNSAVNPVAYQSNPTVDKSENLSFQKKIESARATALVAQKYELLSQNQEAELARSPRLFSKHHIVRANESPVMWEEEAVSPKKLDLQF